MECCNQFRHLLRDRYIWAAALRRAAGRMSSLILVSPARHLAHSSRPSCSIFEAEELAETVL